MRTLIVSDLHLGTSTGVDLLRRASIRRALWDAAADADRLVLLGDVLELRHGPHREAMAGAREFFEDLGRAFAGREVILTAGNHDHALVEPWLSERALNDRLPLGLEQRFDAGAASPMVKRLAMWAAPSELSVAYPGLWIRDDVYATHGHYLDCHLTVPTMERLGIGAVGRMIGGRGVDPRSVDDYEAMTEPVFAWIDAMAQNAHSHQTLNGATTVRAWRALGGGQRSVAGRSTRPEPRGRDAIQAVARARVRESSGELLRERLRAASDALRTRALGRAFPLLVSALNHAGIGHFNADISSVELRRAGLRAMGEVSERLGLGDGYVVFGHTHRAGPLQPDNTRPAGETGGDDQGEWLAPSGARMINSGCWTYDSYFLTSTPGESPYWPGRCVVVEDEGPPVLRSLLGDLTHSDLAPGSR